MNGFFTYQYLLPVLIVLAYGLLLLVMSPLLKGSGGMSAGIACMGLCVAGWDATLLWGTRGATAYGMARVDEFAIYFDLVFLLVGLLAVLASSAYLDRAGANHGEYYALILISVAGMMTMAGSQNILMIFVGLEMLSIPLYVLSGLTRMRRSSIEASLKYFLLGAFSTGFILYGMAFIYGATGSLKLPMIVTQAQGGPMPRMLALGLGLVLIGFLFKIAAVPFHFWAPDVYQGAPTTVTAFMAAGTKAAAFAAILRILGAGFPAAEHAALWAGLVTAVAILTMTVANVTALAQSNVKRMLAWSSIAHAGYLLIAVATMGKGLSDTPPSPDVADGGVQALGFYLVSYALMTMGAFTLAAMVASGRDDEDSGYTLTAYAGLGRRRPILAMAMTVFMLSLAGLPPTAGFIAKFYLFKGAIDGGLYLLAFAGAFNAVVGAAYYLKVVVAMYMKQPAGEEPVGARMTLPVTVAVTIAVCGTFYLGVFPERLLDFAHRLFGAIR